MERQRTLGQRDIVMYTVSAILLLETLTAAASMGAAAIFWWLFLGVVFLVPFALICAEMGCAYPEQGGIYAWVRDAFGGRWGARASWGYWVNTAVWLPAIYILFAGIFTQLFAPGLSLFWQIAIGIGLTWITVALNIVTLDIGKWVPNLGAVVKVIVFLIIIAAAASFAADEGFANPINLDTMRPDWGSSLAFIPALIYGMLGFELISASSEEMKDPARDVPRGVMLSAAIILILYTGATAAVLAAIPAEEIDLVEGLVATLQRFFGEDGSGAVIVMLLGAGALYTFFTNGVTWALGCNRAAAEAGVERELPPVFARETSSGTPVGAAVLMGLFSSVVLVLYGTMANSAEDLFWSLFAFSAVIFLLPYLGLLLAFVKCRKVDGERYRPFRVPGGDGFASFCAYLCFFILSVSIVLFIYTPEEGMQYPVFWGALVTLLIGEVTIRVSEKLASGD
jgi:amino acid transporter